MNSTYLVTTIAITAALLSQAAVARSDQTRSGHDSREARPNPVLVTVPNSSSPHQASYGWQYFSDPRAARAVVISPSGEYFLSLGDGPQQITGPAGYLLKARSTQN